jgi:hypothetical protein|eukprot:COSAG01_NODE_3291_length_6306_cov_2.411632_7_plen_48_part_00
MAYVYCSNAKYYYSLILVRVCAYHARLTPIYNSYTAHSRLVMTARMV